ncbi:PadR family transcriptional regulator [Clostridium sp. CTA-7]
MPREQFQNLTEPMYYILMSLIEERCGVDIMTAVDEISKGRVKVGPGTLYALLGKFQKENMIKETEVEGRRRSYIITEKGMNSLKEEYERIMIILRDGEKILGGMVNDNR